VGENDQSSQLRGREGQERIQVRGEGQERIQERGRCRIGYNKWGGGAGADTGKEGRGRSGYR
jgi:hypothetical protein